LKSETDWKTVRDESDLPERSAHSHGTATADRGTEADAARWLDSSWIAPAGLFTPIAKENPEGKAHFPRPAMAGLYRHADDRIGLP
jgi:hypothetical protein